MPSIKLSPKHGVNPSLRKCFFCGEQTGELLLMGRLKGDAEAPHEAIVDYQPCEKCQKKWEELDARVLIGVTEYENVKDQPPITKEPVDLYPTGSYVCVTEEAVNRWLEPETAKAVNERKMAFMDSRFIDNIIEKSKEMQN